MRSLCLLLPLFILLIGAVAAANTGAKPLNNLVVELLNITGISSCSYAEWTFTNPRDGWVFLHSILRADGVGSLRISVDNPSPANALIVSKQEAAGSQEAMCFLPGGQHTLRVWQKGKPSIERLVVRAIPELLYSNFPQNPIVREYGPYNWSFLQKHVLPNVNCIISGSEGIQPSRVAEWKRQGKQWLVELTATPFLNKMSAEDAYRYWADSAGMTDPLVDGVIVDEFTMHNEEAYPAMTESLHRLYQDAVSRNKRFDAYFTDVYRSKAGTELLRTILDAGGKFALETYLPEPPTEEAAQQYLKATLDKHVGAWQQAIPGCQKQLILTLGYMSAPNESLNVDPSVDFKVWMDIQFQHVATSPRFAGLYGLMEYKCNYADEETVRWAARLYRHYGIEGRTELLSPRYGFVYRLNHLQNPDFAEGTQGWTVQPAEADSITTKEMEGLSWLEGRYPRTSRGDIFLWMRRSAQKPNTVAQEIKNLQPGRLYSLKLFTADYRDLSAGKSVRKKHAVSIHLDNVGLVPGKGFQAFCHNNYSHHLGPFTDKHKAWMNYHVRVFRAKGPTAQLTLSDWANATTPGSPIGQETLFNFVEVQPYFEQ